MTTKYALNSAKLIVLRENFKALQDINTTPKEPKTERVVAVDSALQAHGSRGRKKVRAPRGRYACLSRAPVRACYAAKTAVSTAVLTTIPCVRWAPNEKNVVSQN